MSSSGSLRVLPFRVVAMPQLMLRALPWVVGAVVGKAIFEIADVHPLELNPLLSGLVAANVFLLGFLLAGTLADYKEAEKLPGELAASLETICDEALLIHEEKGIPEAAQCIELCADVASDIRRCIMREAGFKHVLKSIRAFNPIFLVFSPLIQPGFTTRLKIEQANIRKTVIRIETIRSTTFVNAGYAIAELTGVLLIAGLMLTEVAEKTVESLFFVGVITLLLTYVFFLIRDLDNPFAYPNGREGAADVSLTPVLAAEQRLRSVHRRLSASESASST
jgi:hypothetical protein